MGVMAAPVQDVQDKSQLGRGRTEPEEVGPGSVQDRSSAWPQGADNIKRRRKSSERKDTENLRDSADQVTANSDTQLGAFGPGADPKRSRAAIPPPRLPSNVLPLVYFKLNISPDPST